MFSVSMYYLFLLIGLNLLTNIFNSIRYRIIIQELLKGKITHVHSFFISCGSNLSNYIMPFKSGVLLGKPYLTKKFSDMNFKQGLVVTLFEQAFETGIIFLMLPILLYFLGDELLFKNSLLSIILFLFLLTLTILSLFNIKRIVRWLIKLKKFSPKFILGILSKKGLTEKRLIFFMDKFSIALKNKTFFTEISILTILILLLNPLQINFAVDAFGYSISYKQAFLAYWVALAIGRLSGLPGGIGARDVTMAGLLMAFGLNATASVSIALYYRIVTIIFILITGIPIFILVGKKDSLRFKDYFLRRIKKK